VHADHLGTPVLVTQSDKTERWRWENDPFGRGDPVEYTVSGQDVSPDDDASSGTPLKYNTCCCGGGGCGAGCNQCQTSCSAGQCTGGGSQDVLWQKTYTVAGANNVRLHFSTFDVAAGTTRTGKDYVRLLKGSDGTTVVADLTGNLGDFWGPWAGVGESSIVMKLYGDNVQDNTRGFVVDKLEYTTATNGRFVMHLRMPGQVWDEEAKMSQSLTGWYRREDGRYLDSVSRRPIVRAFEAQHRYFASFGKPFEWIEGGVESTILQTLKDPPRTGPWRGFPRFDPDLSCWGDPECSPPRTVYTCIQTCAPVSSGTGTRCRGVTASSTGRRCETACREALQRALEILATDPCASESVGVECFEDERCYEMADPRWPF
jgi:hypothetical protein